MNTCRKKMLSMILAIGMAMLLAACSSGTAGTAETTAAAETAAAETVAAAAETTAAETAAAETAAETETETEGSAEEAMPMASALLHLDDNTGAVVTVDLSGGCRADFAYGSIYFYQPGVTMTEYDEAAGYVYVISQEEYDAEIAEYSAYESFEQTSEYAIVREGEEEGNQVRYYVPVDTDHGIYLLMTGGVGTDYESIFARFTAEPEFTE